MRLPPLTSAPPTRPLDLPTPSALRSKCLKDEASMIKKVGYVIPMMYVSRNQCYQLLLPFALTTIYVFYIVVIIWPSAITSQPATSKAGFTVGRNQRGATTPLCAQLTRTTQYLEHPSNLHGCSLVCTPSGLFLTKSKYSVHHFPKLSCSFFTQTQS